MKDEKEKKHNTAEETVEFKKKWKSGKGMAKKAIKKTGTFHGKSNKFGGGGRAAQMKAKGMSGALIGWIGRKNHGAKAMAKASAAGRKRA